MSTSSLNGSVNGQHNSNQTLKDEDEVNIGEILNKYRNHLPFFVLSLVISCTMAFLYLKYKAPVYKSSISILIKDDAKKSGTDMSQQIMSELVMGTKSNVANELELIKSYTLMTKVVKILDLNTTYSVEKNLGFTSLYKNDTIGKFLRFNRVKDSSLPCEVQIYLKDNKIYYLGEENEQEIKNNEIVNTPDFSFTATINNFGFFQSETKYKATWVSPTNMAKGILEKVLIEPLNKEASIMLLSLSSEVPLKAQDILNTLSNEYNKSGIEEVNQVADSTIRFIDERLALIARELGIVENNLLNFRETNNVIAIEGQENFQLERLKSIREKMDALDIQMQVADMVSKYVNNPDRPFSLAPSSLGIQDPALLGMVQQYNSQVLKREELLKTLPGTNIAITTIERELRQLQQNIIETADNIKISYQSAYKKSKGDNDQLISSFNSIPRKEKQMLEIARQQGIKEKLYLYLLEKREEAAISKASTASTSSPIDPSTTDNIPESPKKIIIIALALAFGLGVPISYIFIKDLLANKIVTRNDIILYTKAPIIGEISHNTSSERQIVADKTRGVIPEQFRIVRTNLQYFIPGKSKSTILVSSSMPGEGKTFISMNMGAVLASTGKKVVLLEFDMRKPKIAEALGLHHNGLGLSTFLSGGTSLKDMIQPVEGVNNFFFIPTGPIPPNPAELLTTEKIEQLFTELKASFDHIIIDSPPTIIVSDSKMLSKYCDISLYVIRQRYTLKENLKFVDELYVNNTLKNIALIVNDVKMTGAQGYHGNSVSYGYGNGYNYDYSHGYGYGQKKEKRGWLSWYKAKKSS